MKKIILLISGVFLLGISSFATHIVGGVIYYEYISGTTYRITFKAYKDCGAGITTGFDGTGTNPRAEIGIYQEGTNALIQTIDMGSPTITTIAAPISNPCMTTTGICVQEGVYTQTVTLPSNSTAYYLTYVRCCRNNSISNINAPESTGSTITVRIPPTVPYRNSNPVYNSFPPIYICLNAPLVFNHSATDADGDSLYYELCTPLTGASPSDPAPGPSSAPYTELSWRPPYSLSNVLGGTPLTVNPNNGVMTGTPNAVGQFVVGVCVSEYRDGVLLSTTLRDFQFNVVNCPIPIANIPSTNIDPTTGIGDYIINCEDYTVRFNHRSSGAVSYFWNFGDPTSTSDTARTASPSYTYPDTGVYLVMLVAINASGCVDTTYAYVKIYPEFTANFLYDNACVGEPINFLDSSATYAGLIDSRLWTFGDGSSSTLTNPTHAYSAAGSYGVNIRVTTTKGCVKNTLHTVIINPLPDASFTFDTTCIHSPVNFTNTSTGASGNYTWSFGDGDSSDVNNPIHTYTSIGIVDVSLNVVSDSGCADSYTIPLTVHPLPTVVANSDTIVCPGNAVQLSATGGVRYWWMPGFPLSDPNIPNPIAIVDTQTIFHVRAADGNRCQNEDSTTVFIYELPLISAGPDTSVCLNPGSIRDSVHLQATGGNAYLWSPASSLTNPSISNPWAKPSVNTDYNVRVTDLNGCIQYDTVRVTVLDPSLEILTITDTGLCIYDTITLNVLDQGAEGYLWTPNVGISDPTANSPRFYPLDTTTYIVTINNYCYTKSDTITLNVYPLPIVDAGRLDSICIGDTFQINANGGRTYVWQPDSTLWPWDVSNPRAFPTTDNTYYFTATDDLGCSNSDSVTILVYPYPVPYILPVPRIICRGDRVLLQAFGGVRYLWHPGSLLNDSTINTPTAQAEDTVLYIVEVTNSHGCTTPDSVTLNIQQPISAVTSPVTDVCYGELIRLLADGGLYYQWFPPYNMNDNLISNPYVWPDSSMTYYVKISNDCFSDTAQTDVVVHPLPTVNAGPDDTINRNERTVINANVDGEFYWIPSEYMNDPFSPNPVVFPVRTTDYVLHSVSPYGCENTDTVRIYVVGNTVLLVPTGFSPNGDGVNDVFKILKMLNIEHLLDFSVYNRYGARIFSTNSVEEGWDGTLKNVPQEIGVYAWTVEGIDYDGNRIFKKGNVTLLR